MIETYTSFDNKEFHNKQECIDYENNFINITLRAFYDRFSHRSDRERIIRSYIDSLNDNFINELTPCAIVSSFTKIDNDGNRSNEIAMEISLYIRHSENNDFIKVISTVRYCDENIRICDIPGMIKDQYNNTLISLRKMSSNNGEL